MVGHLLEYHPATVALQALVDGGELGQIHYIYSNRLNLGKIRTEENILWSFAPHDISVILRLLGRAARRGAPATGGSYLQPRIADVTMTCLSFPSGVRGAHLRELAASLQGAEAGRGRRPQDGRVRRHR